LYKDGVSQHGIHQTLGSRVLVMELVSSLLLQELERSTTQRSFPSIGLVCYCHELKNQGILVNLSALEGQQSVVDALGPTSLPFPLISHLG
jgi:hypothetical protein